MQELSEINVIEKINNTEIKEKGSRFLCFAMPIENIDEVQVNLDKFKKEFYDASHHCYAYKLIEGFKYSDAGEPSGTAGIRILNAIEHFNLINILVVVVRYFGGTKLGVGRLGRAYYEGALKVLDTAEIRKKFLYQKIIIKIDFQFVQKIYNLFNNSENHIKRVNYSQQAIFECLVRPEYLNKVFDEINAFSAGKAEIVQFERIYY